MKPRLALLTVLACVPLAVFFALNHRLVLTLAFAFAAAFAFGMWALLSEFDRCEKEMKRGR